MDLAVGVDDAINHERVAAPPIALPAPAELRADMSEVFALHRNGAFERISTTRYALRKAAELHARVERLAVPAISVLKS